MKRGCTDVGGRPAGWGLRFLKPAPAMPTFAFSTRCHRRLGGVCCGMRSAEPHYAVVQQELGDLQLSYVLAGKLLFLSPF